MTTVDVESDDGTRNGGGSHNGDLSIPPATTVMIQGRTGP